ncbi:response regulator [Hoeflea prorocentri]|uniref:Regulatory protein VirG n=1 Tax=Hoeflea prorocentri TaxID=1922333 RepID=A0A9X3UF03_9HYPH|nr:response regulator transcription factor [Hoeflea prorocentri]MCY6379660.1 response regulator transcription factor [Hoeflea prorocentri]MDA5397460.1 response regulator transcription factor [Hoeflea prorocentri]
MAVKKTGILVVDDEPKVRLLLRRLLEMENFFVAEAGNSREALDCMDKHSIDLVTLDLNLGSENGLNVALAIRAKRDVPIVMVTGKGDIIDRVVGLEMGADDYITKPFHGREVVARVRSVLRRSGGRAAEREPATGESKPKSDSAVYHVNGWTICPSSMELFDTDGCRHSLTSQDFKLLTVFLKNPKRVLSRDQIMDRTHGSNWTPYDRTVDNQIARLRKKIEKDPNNPTIIKTVRGVGYIMTADVEMCESEAVL